MVVVGSRGRGRVAGLKLGSVAWKVAVHGHGPVVMVRGQWHAAPHAPGPVAVGVDGSSASRAAIAVAFAEAALHGVPLLAVCALADAPGTLGGAPKMEADFSHAMTVCEKEHPGVTVLRQAALQTALLAAAAEAQLLLVGCSGVPGMNLGSVAQAMLHYAPCPVGVIHPPASPGDGVTAADG
jgi:nucleotide-binding universal stress UspA family protein